MTDDLAARRQAEVDKYSPAGGRLAAYSFADYRMTDVLRDRLTRLLNEWGGVSYLDVSCGRGESLFIAEDLYLDVVGTEATPELVRGANMVHALLPHLPFGDKAFHTVSCLDVMEHIIEEDWEASIKELGRVCGKRLILSISNTEDHAGKLLGVDLHISRFPYTQTDAWLREWLPGFKVAWREDMRMDHAEVWECIRE